MAISVRLFWSLVLSSPIGAIAASICEWLWLGHEFSFERALAHFVRIGLVGALLIYPLLLFFLKRRISSWPAWLALIFLLGCWTGILGEIFDGSGFVAGAVGGLAAGLFGLLVLTCGADKLGNWK